MNFPALKLRENARRALILLALLALSATLMLASGNGPNGINIGFDFNWNYSGPAGYSAAFIASVNGSGAGLETCLGPPVTSSTSACNFPFAYGIGGVAQTGVVSGGVYDTWPTGPTPVCNANPTHSSPLTLYNCFNTNSFGQVFLASSTGSLSSFTIQMTCLNPAGTAPTGLIAFIYLMNPNGISIPATPLAMVPVDLSSCPTLTSWSGHTFSSGDFAAIPLDFSSVTVNSGSFYAVFFGGPLAPGSPLPGSPVPPTITKAFGASSIAVGGQTSLTFTVTNTSTTDATGVAFTDNLPSGLTTPNGTSSQCGGTLTVASNSIALTGATVSNGEPCSFSVTVTGASAGVKNNVTGAVSSTNGGTGATASASITVLAGPSLTLSVGSLSIGVGAQTPLTFTITDPNATTATGVSFTDTLPSGLTAANATNSQCGGTLTVSNNSIALAGATVANGSVCTFSVNVTGTTAGVKNDVTSAVTSTNVGTGNSATASITVVSGPVITESFGASSIAVGAQTLLTFTITDPNTTTATGVAFTDHLPLGLAAANSTTSQCGGTVTISNNSIALSAATVTNSSPCTFSITVTGTAAGAQNNVTSAVTSTNLGTGSTGSASITITAPVNQTPAPGTFLLLLIGLVVIGWLCRREFLKMNEV